MRNVSSFLRPVFAIRNPLNDGFRHTDLGRGGLAGLHALVRRISSYLLAQVGSGLTDYVGDLACYR